MSLDFAALDWTDWTLPPSVPTDTISFLMVLCCLQRHISSVGLQRYLFVFSVDVNFLGADGLADVVDVVLPAVIEDVFILFPESDKAKTKTKC